MTRYLRDIERAYAHTAEPDPNERLEISVESAQVLTNMTELEIRRLVAYRRAVKAGFFHDRAS